MESGKLQTDNSCTVVTLPVRLRPRRGTQDAAESSFDDSLHSPLGVLRRDVRSCNAADATWTRHSPDTAQPVSGLFLGHVNYICRCCPTIWECPLPTSADEVNRSQ